MCKAGAITWPARGRSTPNSLLTGLTEIFSNDQGLEVEED
jgi:hypothetical protein